MDQRAEDSSHSQSSHPVIPSGDLADGLNSPDISEKDRKDPDRGLEGGDSFRGSQLTVREGMDKKGGEAEGGVGYTISVESNEQHPSTTEGMEQSKPAEQQGGDLGLAQEREANREVKDEKEASEALVMDDEEEDEEEEKVKEGDSASSHKSLPVETLVSEADVEEQQLHHEVLTEGNLHEDSQVSTSQGVVYITDFSCHYIRAKYRVNKVNIEKYTQINISKSVAHFICHFLILFVLV